MEENDPLNRLIAYIEKWLSTNEQNQRAVAPLTDLLELYKWARDTLAEMPSDARLLFDRSAFNAEVTQVGTWLSFHVPPLPEIRVSDITASLGSSTGIASNLLFTISKATNSENDRLWLSGKYESFGEIQKRQQKLQKTRGLLQKLDGRNPNKPDLVEEYDLVLEKAFYYRGSEVDTQVSAGIAMRNLLEHYKGKIETIARSHPKENMTFEEALSRLSQYPSGSIMRTILLNEIATWDRLQSRLSDLAKNKTRSDLRQSAIELIAHVYTVLALIKI